jgi:hypothetical protein
MTAHPEPQISFLASSPEFVGEFGTDSNEKLGFFGVLQGFGSQGM